MSPQGITTILILLIIFGSIFTGRYLRYRMRMFELKLKAEKETSSELRVELSEIRDRLSVLEKIVTDKGYRVREEIDQL